MLRFPNYEEIPLENPPINEVVCQVRFPPILRIAKEQPVDFQERVRSHFPMLEVGQEFAVHVAPFSQAPASATTGVQLFHFKTTDQRYIATLAPNFFALSTPSYSHWEEFSSFLAFLAESVIDVYDIELATRVGLRYINHFTPENTGVRQNEQLWEFLRPELRSFWKHEAWDFPLETLSLLTLAGEDNERLAIRFGYRANERVCILDLDYFSNTQVELTPTLLLQSCDRYHRVIYQAFRWAVPEEKLATFGAPSVNREFSS